MMIDFSTTVKAVTNGFCVVSALGRNGPGRFGPGLNRSVLVDRLYTTDWIMVVGIHRTGSYSTR